jgi:hypothetical protein
MILTEENGRTRRKTCPSPTMFTTNPTWTDSGANPGLPGERLATNRLSHDTAKNRNLWQNVFIKYRIFKQTFH